MMLKAVKYVDAFEADRYIYHRALDISRSFEGGFGRGIR
jgi:hypothetical protein